MTGVLQQADITTITQLIIHERESRDEFTPAILGQTVTIPEAIIKDYRPSYRNLSYSLHLTGYEVNPNLPGEDKPETVDILFNKIYQWAGLEVPT